MDAIYNTITYERPGNESVYTVIGDYAAIPDYTELKVQQPARSKDALSGLPPREEDFGEYLDVRYSH